MLVRFERSVHNFGPGVQIAYLEGNEPKTSWFLKDVPRLREKEIMGVNMRLKDITEDYLHGSGGFPRPGCLGRMDGICHDPFRPLCQFLHVLQEDLPAADRARRACGGRLSGNKEAFREEFEKWRKRVNGLE